MNEKAVRFFDDVASDYNNKYEKVDDLRSFIFSERKKTVLAMLGTHYRRILDIGCGPGVYAMELSARCEELYGADVSSEMIEIARKKNLPNARFSVSAIEKMEFPDGYFDAAVCIGVLEYLDDMEKAISEVARVTADGAVAVFTGPNASSFLNRLDLGLRGILKACRRYFGLDLSKSFLNYDFEPRLLSRKEVESMLKKHGFGIEESKYHVFRISLLNRISPRMSLALAKKMNFISSRFLAINYVVKAVKYGPPS